ncbi:MAG: aspartyl protease family protein [Nanoarchaeota archaeon]|nr:aspartyl protease family protein [Nanoarchaeota archaeon]
MKYPYQYSDGIFLPLVAIKIKGKLEWVEFKAFVDTGASYSLFHADVAEILGLELEKGESREMVLGDGDLLKVFVHKIKVALAGKEFLASIGFSREVGIGFYIIGRKDLFDKFLVIFNEKERWVEFKPL